ncbi:NAD(P)-binding protein [Favolaschia claudopus]|uniref:NAD(P)-binding protein n=1 Tax=Favolaschia claudopus TaxID=2862362 RepID=A0AAW0DB98_9AGAR
MAHPNFLLNQRVLVVGGSSGLGFGVASAALANGSKVHITSTSPDKLSTKIALLQSLYPGAHVSGSVTDLANTETLEANLLAVVEAAVKETGGALNHVTFTAGDAVPLIPLSETNTTTALKPFTVRFLAPLILGKFIAANPGRYVEGAASSSVTLTSGTLAHRPPPGMSPLVGAAGAAEVLARALAVDLAPIRVNVVCPGPVKTELMENMYRGRMDLVESMKKGSLTKTLGTPEHAAEAYLFCMRSVLATGQNFIIDNGVLLA